jgi:DNA-binding Xre family transcriptional regulator
MNIQKNVAEYVRGHGIKQMFIVEQTGISKAKISQMLGGTRRMTVNEFAAICKALKKQPNDFINIDEE